jgi:hypothetical protein
MREPHQHQQVNTKTRHEQTVESYLPLDPNSALINLATATPPQHPITTTIVPSQLITFPYASDIRKLKNLTLPTNYVYRTHPSTRQRLSHISIAKSIRHDELQKTKKATSTLLVTSIPRDGGGSSDGK